MFFNLYFKYSENILAPKKNKNIFNEDYYIIIILIILNKEKIYRDKLKVLSCGKGQTDYGGGLVPNSD